MAMAGIGHNQPPGLTSTKRWIKVYTDEWREHPLIGKGLQVRPRGGWGDRTRTYNRGEAFEDLMFMARWKAGSVEINGHDEWLEVGQLFGAVAYLEERWNWSAKTIRTWLRNLEEEGIITRAKERAKARGNGKGEGNGAINGNGSGTQKCKGNYNPAQFSPSVITICNYSIIQSLQDQIEVYVQEAKGQRQGQRQGHTHEPAQGQREGQRDGNPEGQEIQTDIHTDNNPSESGGREKDPFGLNPYEQASPIQRGKAGEIVLSDVKRSEWLELFNHDAIELELALKEVATAIQSNSTTPLQAQVERLLAKEARYRRERESRSQKRVANRTPSATGKTAHPSGMSIDERLRIERERKAQERQQ